MKKLLLAALIFMGMVVAVIAVIRGKPAVAPPVLKEQSYSTVEQENIRQFWQHYRQATQYRVAGRLKLALSEYQQALSFNANHEDALYYAGNLYRAQGDSQQAIDCWTALLRINPQSTRTHLQLGDLYLDPAAGKGFDPTAAEAEYLRALEINGEASKALLRMGQVALVTGDLEVAGERFAALAGTGKTGITAGFLKGYVAWKQGVTREALTYFKNAVNHSMPEKAVGNFSQEGDTRDEESSDAIPDHQYHLLQNVELRDLVKVDAAQLAVQMDLKYRKLDAYLTNLTNRIP